MRRWMHVGLVTTATLVGMTALAPAAPAVTGDGVPATDTTATDPSLMLPPELLNCIAPQVDVLDQISFSQVCQRWRAAAHKYPVFAQNLKVARTQGQLNVALNTAGVSPVVIVIVPDEDMTIDKAPANPHAHITIHDTKPPCCNPVAVRADIHVTASGTATLTASGSAQVTASGNAKVLAFGTTQVTASDNARVSAYVSAQVTATGNAEVYALNSARVTASDNVKVYASNQSRVTATGNATVSAFDSARVTASDSATVNAYDSAQVTATNTTRAWAFRTARVTATDSATVNACDRSQVTATGAAAVIVRSAETRVFVRDSSVRLWVTDITGPAVQPNDGVNPTITTCTSGELIELKWEELALPTR